MEMDASDSSIDWNTEDELDICDASDSSGLEATRGEEKRCLNSSSSFTMIHRFVDMGFPEKLVIRAIEENGEGEDEESILDSLITNSTNSWNSCSSSMMIHHFVDMRFPEELVIRAIEENGEDEEAILDSLLTNFKKKRRIHQQSRRKEKNSVEESISLPNPMIGFGIPGNSYQAIERKLHESAAGPPYFYYENVAQTPKGVWSKISRFLYDIEPEFVDSIHFCAAARKRGYIHNLPIENRFPLKPRPPQTIQEALPATKKWWPSWDKRTKLNCLLTNIASAKVTQSVRKALEDCDVEPSASVKMNVLQQCKQWNLVWVGKNKVAPLEPDEIEMLLGFPKNHTRGGGISNSDRYKSLGNSFQVDTVAYHLSVLKGRYPQGINVLSLFTGIGGAEVAVHRLGIAMKNVVSVEISQVNRNILRSWWEQTSQKGRLIEIADVQQIECDSLERWMSSFGGFDLVIGGSPCNNLAGRNRVSRDGLEGEQSSLFYHYFRILGLVRSTMGSC